MTVAVLVLDDELRAHLAEALGAHVAQLRRDGRAAPRSLIELLDLTAQTPVRSGQERTPLDPTDQRLLTVRQAARRLGCGERTVRRRVTDGTLTPVKFGRRVYLFADDLPGVAS